jgi:hypothetical protein
MACLPCMVGIASAGPLAPIAALGATAYYLTKKNKKSNKKKGKKENKKNITKRGGRKRKGHTRKRKGHTRKRKGHTRKRKGHTRKINK